MAKKFTRKKPTVKPIEKENTAFLFNQRKSIREEFSRWVFCIICTLLLYSIVAFIVTKIYNPDTQAIIEKAQEVSFLNDFNPEPVERLLYVLGLLIVPFSLLLFYLLSLKKIFISFFEKKGFFYAFIIITVAAVAGLFYFTFISPNPFYTEGASNNLNAHDIKTKTNFDFYFYQTTLSKIFWIYTVVIIPLLVLFYFFVVRKIKGKLLKVFNFIISIAGYFFSALLVFAVVKMNIYEFPSTWQAQYDLNAVYYSTAQVYSGSQMLINDFTNTYGLYPHFLKPVFDIFGLSIHSFTVVMSILLCVCFASIFIFMRKFVADKLLLFLGFISTFFLPYIYNRLVTEFDSVFALFPIRMLLVALTLLFASLWFIVRKEKWKKVIYYIGTILLSFGILWNPEFGMIAFISWFMLQIYVDFYTEEKKVAWMKILKHLIVGVGAIFVAFTCYAILQKITYGTMPQMAMMFSTLAISQLGFFMLPMQLVHPWMITTLCFTIGLTYSIASFVKKKTTHKAAAIFLVSVLGFGIFAYFQGRSHNWNLTPIFLLFFICLTLLVDELWKIIKEYNIKPLYIIFAIGLFCLTFSTIDIFSKSKEINKLAKQEFEKQQKRNLNKEYSRIKENIKFIDEKIEESEEIFVFTTNKFHGFYFDGKKKCSAVNPAFIELFYKSDLQRYINVIQDSSYKIFYDPLGFYYGYGEGIRAAMAANYVIKECLYDTTTIVFTYLEKQIQKIPIQSFFPPHEKTVFYEKFSSDSVGCAKRIEAALGYPNIEECDSYSIEVLLYPEKQMRNNPVVFSNATDTSGFFMNFMSKTEENDYQYLIGFNGRGFMVTLDSGKWNYVVIEIQKNNLSLYLNGIQIVRGFMQNNYLHPVDTKLFIGNMNTRRNYFGLISEVAITNGIKPASDIAARWNLIKEINQIE